MQEKGGSTYRSWPLGHPPKSLTRPELGQLRERGFTLEDPRDAVRLFEEHLAQYTGSKFAVVTDTCSHAIFLSLKYRKAKGAISIPRNTYVSVPMQIIHAGCQPVARTEFWSGQYEMKPVGIIDAAARLTSDMYVGEGQLQTLSFQIKKRLPIGKGGAILTDDEDAYRWLKLASYDGRDLDTPYTDRQHVIQIGWHYYMTPEDAARGLLLLLDLPRTNADVMDWQHYPDWTAMKFASDPAPEEARP